MTYDVIARRWARAVFDIGKESGSVARLEADISAFAHLYAGNEELRTVLENPLVLEPEREAVVVAVAGRMGLSEAAVSTLRLLGRKRRLAAIPDVARQLARLADEDQGVLRAEVQSAAPLGADYLTRLGAAWRRPPARRWSSPTGSTPPSSAASWPGWAIASSMAASAPAWGASARVCCPEPGPAAPPR